jgi:sugar phosphate permease
MFVLEGMPAIIWAFFWLRLVEDSPLKAKWLSASEKNDLEEQLLNEQKTIKPVKNYGEAFKSRAVILLCLQYALWSIGVYGFVLWLPSMINSSINMNMVKTGWLASIPYLLAIAGMLGASYFSDKTLKRKVFIYPFLLIGAIAFYFSYLLGTSNFMLSFILLVVAGGAMYAPYGPFFAVLTEMLPRNVAGGAIALINSFGALGSFAGAYVVGYLNGTTGGYGASYIFMAGSLLISAFITMVVLESKGKRIAYEVKGTSQN